MKITNLEKIVRISQEGNPRFLSLEEDSTRSYVSFYIEERSDEEEERSLGDEDLGENQEVRSATTRSFVSFDIEERSDDEEKRSVGDEELGRNQEASSTFSDGGYQGDSECTDDEQLVGVEDFDDLAFTEPIEGDDKGYIPEAPPTPKRRNNKPTDAVDEGSDRPDSIAELLENLRMSNGDLSSVEKPIRRHVKNFHYAQNQRAKKHRFRPFGIIGLFCNLSGIRSDLHWAGDAAWRRRHGKPHISWEDFEAKRNKGLGFPFFTCLIIMASISMMIIAFYMNGWKIEDMEINPLYGPSPDTLLKIGALEAQVMIETGTWWRLVTPICLHGGIIHLTINIVTIGILGRAVERNHGFVNTAILFFVPAIGGNIISGVMQPRYILVGSSGGIFGLIGVCVADIILNWKLMFLVFRAEGRNSGCLIRLCCIIWVCFDLAINSLIGFTPYVDNYAHLGGLVYGILLALTMLERLPLSFFDKGNGTCFKFRMFMIRFLGATIAAVLVVVSAVLLIRSDGTATPCPKCRYISCLPFPFWTEKKWWYCDGCDGISGDISRLRGTEYFSELTLYCPYSDIVQVDLESKYSEVSQIELVLPDFCREHC